MNTFGVAPGRCGGVKRVERLKFNDDEDYAAELQAIGY